jgi:hypothetical protein
LYDTLVVPATPLVPSDDDATDDSIAATSAVAMHGAAAVPPSLGALSLDEHEDAARKQRVRRKQAVDSAFEARRSSRLASKEPAGFVSMLTKAKTMKASRFDLSGGSLQLRAAAEEVGFMADSDPGPLPLPRLQKLVAACGVDPNAIATSDAVSSSSE